MYKIPDRSHCYSIVACTLQATRRSVQDTQRSGLEPVLIYCSMHTGCVAICAAPSVCMGFKENMK